MLYAQERYKAEFYIFYGRMTTLAGGKGHPIGVRQDEQAWKGTYNLYNLGFEDSHVFQYFQPKTGDRFV